jgi:hypothetical protein
MDYFNQRIMQAEERIFSHVDLYQRPKLKEDKHSSVVTVYNVHSVLGSNETKWVVGLISMKEDGHYYLEDTTYDVKISFAELTWVEPDAYFTEMSVVMAQGRYHNAMFYISRVQHPPLFQNKAFKFQQNESDYFGSYVKMTESFILKNKYQH